MMFMDGPHEDDGCWEQMEARKNCSSSIGSRGRRQHMEEGAQWEGGRQGVSISGWSRTSNRGAVAYKGWEPRDITRASRRMERSGRGQGSRKKNAAWWSRGGLKEGTKGVQTRI
jgi:hypothetical protein